MTDSADIQPLMDRAEEAAHRGDFAAAEDALRLAVELQERTLGASSPEVASTLNNLGIVYERLNRPAEAESCYRKSFAIAKAAFAGDHPLVETSATNLREFCDARGIAFEQPEPEPTPARRQPARRKSAGRNSAPCHAVARSSRGATRARRGDVIGIVSSPYRDRRGHRPGNCGGDFLFVTQNDLAGDVACAVGRRCGSSCRA